ncbi:haloacid dehalogenase-like hydrolase [Luteolibacter ambystomatis]|uniref:Haloacid dehalogenase-like hydrolase n=1 Tax=Luteolibacter ambystomatis TaxID=2824561 RepID=A0A975G8M0_9BACT|nr:haloacid dehalogenase-like hydrolase [Luteolibacter ambystomatis]QUE50320.1 haloacid dehalogenase-like hydrolase [Luteolibacter ambystomatis]
MISSISDPNAGVTGTPGEAHVTAILQCVDDTRRAILAKGGPGGTPLVEDGCVFLCFWDFDGTILHGDCCEGHAEGGRVIYSGLLEEIILGGFAAGYPATPRGVAKGISDYRRLERENGAGTAYAFLAQMMSGAREEEVFELAARHFRTRQMTHVFDSSFRMIEGLRAMGVVVHVVSASPDVFIRAIAAELGLDVGRSRGIRTEIENGLLTARLDHPVTYGSGKTAAVMDEVTRARREHPEKQVFVLAGFGNSHHTDGPFLDHIADQILPAGQPLAVMINEIPKSRAFLHVSQQAVRGGLSRS